MKATLGGIPYFFSLALVLGSPDPGQGGPGPLRVADGLRPGETAVEVDAIFPGAEPLNDEGDPTALVFRLEDG